MLAAIVCLGRRLIPSRIAHSLLEGPKRCCSAPTLGASANIDCLCAPAISVSMCPLVHADVDQSTDWNGRQHEMSTTTRRLVPAAAAAAAVAAVDWMLMQEIPFARRGPHLLFVAQRGSRARSFF